MQQALIPCNEPQCPAVKDNNANNNNNGGLNGFPCSDRRIVDLFDALDFEQKGVVPVEIAMEFYNNLEHFGVDKSPREVESMVRKHVATVKDALTYEEFSCFVLSLAQW